MNQTTPNVMERYHLIYKRLHHLPPIGYRIDVSNWKFVVDPESAPLLRKAWLRVLEGMPVDQVLAILNNEGFKTPSRGKLGGKPLRRSAFYKMLADPFYAGYIRTGEQLTQGLHEPLISQEGFLDVQLLLTKRRKNFG